MPSALEIRLDLLKEEIRDINATIARHDELVFKIKGWSITVWSGGVFLALKTPDNPFASLITVAIIPLLFWIVEAFLKSIQRGFIYRAMTISKFVNSDNLDQSFDSSPLVGHRLFDLQSMLYSDDYKNFVKFRRVLFFSGVYALYISLFLVTIIVLVFLKATS